MAELLLFKTVLEQIAEKQHDFASDSLKVALSNTLPNRYTSTVFSDISEISAGNGYTAGGLGVTVVSSGVIYGDYRLVAEDLVLSATGPVGPFRYAVLYNSSNNYLLGFWDFGANITLRAGDSFRVSLDGLFDELLIIGNTEVMHTVSAKNSLGNIVDPVVYTDSLGNTWRSFSFTESGTLDVSEDTQVEILAIGGGGGSSNITYGGSGGGGAGGMINSFYSLKSDSYVVVIGGGGSNSIPGNNGNNSSLGQIVAYGGGGGGGAGQTISGALVEKGQDGGCGGGAGARNIGLRSDGGIGSQGYNGGKSYRTSDSGRAAGGGGGLSMDGQDANPDPAFSNRVAGGNGGDGIEWPSNSGDYYGGGGGGGAGYGPILAPIRGGTGGLGGGGDGSNGGLGTNGTINTGGGGGGSGISGPAAGGTDRTGANGGSGIVIVRYQI